MKVATPHPAYNQLRFYLVMPQTSYGDLNLSRMLLCRHLEVASLQDACGMTRRVAVFMLARSCGSRCV